MKYCCFFQLQYSFQRNLEFPQQYLLKQKWQYGHGAGFFLVVILPVEYNFIPKNKENVAWLIKANHTDERKQFLTQRLLKVVLFFLLICFITTPFPKGLFCCCLDIGTYQSPCFDFTWEHYGHTACGLLVLAFGTAVCSIFRAYFGSIWSLSTHSRNSRSDKMVLCRVSSFLVWMQCNICNSVWNKRNYLLFVMQLTISYRGKFHDSR